MIEYFDILKSLRVYTIVSSFKDKENFSDKDNEYPKNSQYFAKLFHEPQGTYLNQFHKNQELGLIN